MAKQEKNSNWKNYADIVADIKNDSPSRIYLISGEEKYLVDKIVAEMKKRWIASGAESLDFYLKDQSNSDLPIDEFQSLAGTPPFLSRLRMTVIRNTGLFSTKSPSVSADVERWKAAISAVPEFALVVFVEDKVDKFLCELLACV